MLLIPKNLLIKKNMSENSEFYSKILRDVDGKHYNELGWKRILENVQADAIKVKLFFIF